LELLPIAQLRPCSPAPAAVRRPEQTHRTARRVFALAARILSKWASRPWLITRPMLNRVPWAGRVGPGLAAGHLAVRRDRAMEAYPGLFRLFDNMRNPCSFEIALLEAKCASIDATSCRLVRLAAPCLSGVEGRPSERPDGNPSVSIAVGGRKRPEASMGHREQDSQGSGAASPPENGAEEESPPS